MACFFIFRLHHNNTLSPTRPTPTLLTVTCTRVLWFHLQGEIKKNLDDYSVGLDRKSIAVCRAQVLSLLALLVQKYKYWHLRSCLSFNATWTSSKWCVVCYWKREEARVELPSFVLYGCLARILDISQNWGDNPQWWGHDGRGVTVQS